MTEICRIQNVELAGEGDYIILHREGGGAIRFHALWLRDNALDVRTRSPQNGQRLIMIDDIPLNTKITAATLDAPDRLTVEFQPEERSVSYSLRWLQEHSYDIAREHSVGWLDSSVEIWDKALTNRVPTADFETVKRDKEALAIWLGDIRRFGFAKMTGGPIKSGALLGVAALFGFVRETNYGKWFEVRAEVTPTNLAFTSAGLQAHTDNPYRDPVPTMQILYALENSATGGDSLVVDGFKAAKCLQERNPEHFEILARYNARYEYAGQSGVCLQARKPMIELEPDGELVGVRFNNRSIAPVTDVPFDKMPDYYVAYRALSEIINDPAMAVSFRLEPGDCFIVDNTRVLHARNAYSGHGTRWLQGCYPDKDGLLSTLATLEQENLGINDA
ncbi:TauD/TfdA family dioxygenase [Sneathiella sp. HT1-7]|uniref:2-trimethylaminoethylphosphonate dioxygenase n=1 Tax=Sneathiella sp. HT1-7 TaxID=2887192 RepID=UPI001D14FA40|nr:TauD/TfdA family dioxygenase [Sneathiella sp. HT1-7]MCC3306304.1 TauD/TfdA family dioxygenase [Sneathiella sp. HT1-7]